MAKTYPLELAAAGGAILPASAHVSDRDWREFTVRVEWAGGEAAGTDVDAFYALRRVREALDAVGLVPRCYGACRNFVMSPMASQMGGGLAGHLVELGRPAGGAMAMTFEAGPDMDLAAVAEQQAFTRAWFDSLGLRPALPRPAVRPKGLLGWVRSLWRRG
jgi:hypothetical protein